MIMGIPLVCKCNVYNLLESVTASVAVCLMLSLPGLNVLSRHEQKKKKNNPLLFIHTVKHVPESTYPHVHLTRSFKSHSVSVKSARLILTVETFTCVKMLLEWNTLLVFQSGFDSSVDEMHKNTSKQPLASTTGAMLTTQCQLTRPFLTPSDRF